MWMTGGGIEGGVSYGSSDGIGRSAAEGRVSVHDIQATVLHLMRLDHEVLTGQHNGQPFRLTEAAGKVIYPILA